MTKALLFSTMFLLGTLSIEAQTDEEVAQARRKAASFMDVKTNALSRVTLPKQTLTPSVCVFNDSASRSFVIVSTNENMPEILGYSDSGLFDSGNIPPQLEDLLDEYEAISKSATASTKTHKLSAKKATQLRASAKTLTTALYNQEEPYNNYCPSGCYTGCVATAMSIAMKYYEWPKQGRGSHSYEWNGQTLSQNFSTAFDWDNMLNQYEADSYTTTQGNAVAKLCYACGVAVDMNYSTTGSAGSLGNAAVSLVKYFKYSPETILLHQESLEYTSNEWMAMIKEEIDAGRPIIYSGHNSTGTRGHAFIIEGYEDSYVKVNWGWGGHYNDSWFLLSSMIPYDGEDDYRDYSYDHWMIVNIVPDYSESEFSPLQTCRIVSEESMTCDAESIKKNTGFTVTIGNLKNRDDETFEGSIAVALINGDGEIEEICKSKDITLKSGYYYESLSFSCKSNVNSEDGDSLALVWKYADEDEWKRIPGDGVVKSAIPVEGVNETEDGIPYAMLSTVWGQQEVFRSSCPNNYKPGCAAVAVGQIMNYYRATDEGFGTNNYNYLLNSTDTAEVSIDYSQHTFGWSDIIDIYTGNSSATDAQKAAVCDFLYTTGTAMFMQWREGGSSPKNDGSMLWGLHHYLHFSPASLHRYRRFYSTAEWIEMLDAQLVKRQPVFYGGSYNYFGEDKLQRVGHYWVIDGKHDDGLYHANFGTGNSLNLKYTGLDVMQQTVADNAYPGGFAVCYNHNDMMITDLVPLSAATDSDYVSHNLILIRPISFVSEPETQTKSFGQTEAFDLGFVFSNYDRDRGTTYYKIGLYQNGQLVGFANANNANGYHSITLGAGYYLNREKSFILPADLTDGKYEMHFVSQNRETGEWQQVMESVNGTMILVCSDGTATVTLPANHTLPTGLYLKENVSVVADEYNDAQAQAKGREGVSLKLLLINPSDNNFCDTLRFEFKLSSGETKVLDYPASVYDNSELEYHVFIPSQLVDLSGEYTLNLYYYDATSATYLPLSLTSGIGDVKADASATNDLCVYQPNGILVARVPRQRVGGDYAEVLSGLSHGIYIIKDGDATRKVIK